MLLSRAIYDVGESKPSHLFAVTLSSTLCGDHQTEFILLENKVCLMKKEEEEKKKNYMPIFMFTCENYQ